MVGVVKQKKKATGELLEYTIQMGRSVTSEGLETQTKALVYSLSRQQIGLTSTSSNAPRMRCAMKMSASTLSKKAAMPMQKSMRRAMDPDIDSL